MDHIAKRQKVDELETAEEEVLFNSDTLSKVILYLPSIDLLNLALTNKKFGISDDDDPSLIKKSAQIIVQDVATKEQLAALPHYDGESSLADYHYLQLMREPLSFDQLVGTEYVNNDKSCVVHSGNDWETAFSNNILMAGKHYVTFEVNSSGSPSLPFVYIGVMRPGEANQGASGAPICAEFFHNFTRRMGHGDHISNVHCCMYFSFNGECYSSNWGGSRESIITDKTWDGMESMFEGELGMLLDLDEGTLTVFKNGRKLGIMKRGLRGSYCWAVSMYKGVNVTIKRGTIPPS